MSLQRTLARRQRKLGPPLVIARLYRAAAQLHVRQHGLEPDAVRGIMRALKAGELVLELDQATGMSRIRPADTRS